MPNNSSKWGLYLYFYNSPEIRPYLPPTDIFSHSTLHQYLSSYHSVYIKPDREHTGKGIIKVTEEKGGYSYVRVKGKIKHTRNIEKLYQKLKKKIGIKRHVIQKSIPLAKIKKRRFDIRVMMMRDKKGKWKYVGMLAKVAGPNSIITNVRRGRGYVLKVHRALGRFMPGSQIEQVIEKMIQLSYKICHYFNGYKKSSEIGVDLGIDREGNISVIEVNYEKPSHHLFKRLRDKTMYKKIRRMAKQYRKRKRR